MENLTLRGHHLLCTRLFVGNGYSEEFTKHMGEVVTRMKLDNYSDGKLYEEFQTVTVVCESDYICEKCPNKVIEGEKTGCSLGGKNVIKMDELTLKYAGLKPDTTYTLEEFKNSIHNITKEQFDNICGNCRWYNAGYCSYEKLV